MKRRSGRWLPAALAPFALLLVVANAGPARAHGDRWTASSAITSIDLSLETLRDFGIEVVGVEPSAEDPESPGASFRSVPPSLLEFRAPHGDFERFDSGALSHEGGFVLQLRGVASPVDLRGFVLAVASRPGDSAEARLDDFDWLDADGRRFFVLRSMQFTASYPDQELRLVNLSIHVSPELAALVGRPDLAGAFAGTANVRLPAVVAPEDVSGAGAGADCVETPGLPVDVHLTLLHSVSQLAREEGGRVAIAVGASLENLGPGSIAWYEAIAPVQFPGGAVGSHPYLSLAVYRLDPAGRLVQLGLGDVKHAFRALNLGCSCASGPVLYPGCGDDYSASTNVNRLYLAPRDEVTAHTGDWQRVGSHFDRCLALSTPPCNPATDDADDYRDHYGQNGSTVWHDSFEHRLVVPDDSLGMLDASYFVEAWYVTKGDVDIFNSMGWLPVAPFLSGDAWSFVPAGEFANGSVLETIPGAERRTVEPGEGHLQLAAAATDLGGGVHRYEYALMNFDFDRQVERFRVPRPVGTTVTAVDSSGLADDPDNAWTATIGRNAVSWQAPAGRALDWGMLARFGFEVDAAPDEGAVSLAAHEPGSPSRLRVTVLTPAPEPRAWVLAFAGLAVLGILRGFRSSEVSR